MTSENPVLHATIAGPIGQTPMLSLRFGAEGLTFLAKCEFLKPSGSIEVSSADAMRMAQRLAREFGLPVGTSSGANVATGLAVVRRLGRDRRVVALLSDCAERYFGTRLFQPEVVPD